MTQPSPNYYVRFRVSDGTVLTGADGATWFSVSDVAFSSTQKLNLGSQGPTADPYFVRLDPLSFSMGDDPTLPALFADLAAGRVFSSVEVAAYGGSAGAGLLVQDTLFRTAALSGIAMGSDGLSAVLLPYTAVREQVDRYKADGSANTPVVSGWSGLLNVADTAGSPAAPVAETMLTPNVEGSAAPLTFEAVPRNWTGG